MQRLNYTGASACTGDTGVSTEQLTTDGSTTTSGPRPRPLRGFVVANASPTDSNDGMATEDPTATVTGYADHMREAQKPHGGRRTGETVTAEAGSAHNSCDSTDPFRAIRLLLFSAAAVRNTPALNHWPLQHDGDPPDSDPTPEQCPARSVTVVVTMLVVRAALREGHTSSKCHSEDRCDSASVGLSARKAERGNP